MERASAPSYDRFKAIVTFVLVAILILMLLRGCATVTASPISAQDNSNPTPDGSSSPLSTESIISTDSTEAPTASSTPIAVEPTSTPTVVGPAPTPTLATPETLTPEAALATPTELVSVSCNTSVPSRLNLGQKALVVQRLRMRGSASIGAPVLKVNSSGTQVEIIGGPVCTPVGDRAYLWWQIRLEGGMEGWSAEAPLNEANYLLEPIP